jgi:hypothetical protein
MVVSFDRARQVNLCRVMWKCRGVQIGDLHLLLAIGASFGDLALPSVDLGSTLTIGSGTEFQQFESTKCRSRIYTYYWLYKPISA